MADVAKKNRGRPKGSNASPAAVAVKVDEPKKRSIIAVETTNGDDAVPAKRGRGRPPKKGGAAKAKPKVIGRGRGRPPKGAEKKDSQDESESQSDQEGQEST